LRRSVWRLPEPSDPPSPLDADRSTIGELPLTEHGRTTTFGA